MNANLIAYAKDRTIIEFWQPKHQSRTILFLRFLLEGIANILIANTLRGGSTMDDKPTRRTQRKSQRDYSVSTGRPTTYANTMKPTAIYLPAPMLEWLKSKDITLSACVRELVQREMDKQG